MKHLRHLLLLSLPIAAWAVEYQRLTFSDGSVKTGYFDEQKGTLTLTDGSTIAVRIDDIVRRETVTPDSKKIDIPPVPKPPEAPDGHPSRRAALDSLNDEK